MVNRARSQIILDNVVVRVLLQHLDVIEEIVARPETLDEPCPKSVRLRKIWPWTVN